MRTRGKIVQISKLARVLGLSAYMMERWVRSESRNGGIDVLTLSPSTAPNTTKYLYTSDAVRLSIKILGEAFDESRRTGIYKVARDLVR